MKLDKLFKHLQDEHGLNLVWTEKRKVADCLQASPVPELPIESFDADEWLGQRYGIWGHPFIGEQQVSSLMAEFTNEVISKLLPRWYSVDEAMPDDLELVWLSDGKGTTLLGCYYKDGNCWAASDYDFFEMDDRIDSGCEADDLDVKFWHPLPKPIRA